MDSGCIVPHNDEGPSNLYLNGRRAGGVDKCGNCGNYHYSDGTGCFKLKYSSDSNSCEEGDFVGDSRTTPECGGTQKMNKQPVRVSASPRMNKAPAQVSASPKMNVSQNTMAQVKTNSPPASTGMNPLVIGLIVAAIALLVYFFLIKKNKKSFFGKRK